MAYLKEIIQNHKKLIFIIVSFLLVCFLSFFQLNGSSIGKYYSNFFGANISDPNLLFGTPRYIRWDEWGVNTDWTIAQARAGFPVTNQQFGDGINFSLTNVPVANWTLIFRPQYWAYLILPLENAFAFVWWFRAFLMLTATYICLLMLTKENIWASIFFSLAFLFSPYIQWWYSQQELEITAFGLFALITFTRIFEIKNKYIALGYTTLLAYTVIAYSLMLYPPFQVPLALFLLILAAGYLIKRWKSLPIEQKKNVIFCLLGACLLVSVILSFYYFANRTDIETMRNTVYPGERSEVGGGITFLSFFSGPFDIQLLKESRNVTAIFGNQSEGATYFLVAFLCLPIFIFRFIWNVFKRKPINFTMLGGLIFSIIILLYMLVGFPLWMAKLTMLSVVPAWRMMYVAGLVNVFLCAVFIYRERQEIERKLVATYLAYAMLITGVYIKIGMIFSERFPDFIQNNLKIWSIALAMGILVLLLLLQRKFLFPLGLLAFSFVSTYSVNPLYHGLSPILGTELSQTVVQISQTDHSRWVAYNSNLGDYLAANGARVITAVYIYPDLSLWRHFDPLGSSKDVYNRYAHALVGESGQKDPEITRFDLSQPDAFALYVHPCNSQLKKLDVNYFLFPHPVSYSCLKPVKTISFPKLVLYLYSRLD